MPLDPQKSLQLDSNIRNMLANGASQQDVLNYANDFKKKYDIGNPQPQPVTPTVTHQTNESEKNAFVQQIEITPTKIENFKKNKVDNHITEFVFFILFLFIALYFFHKRK
jgi:hypothetical protein